MERHLTHVYGKLGVRNRTEAGALALRTASTRTRRAPLTPAPAPGRKIPIPRMPLGDHVPTLLPMPADPRAATETEGWR